jgi:hypothetical protein
VAFYNFQNFESYKLRKEGNMLKKIKLNDKKLDNKTLAWGK